MEVILIERSKLGNIGEIIDVKPGFARNYLIPRKKALRATEENKVVFEQRKAEIEKDVASKTKEAQMIFDKVNNITVTLTRQAAEDGRLYGSVATNDIAKAINEQTEIALHRSTIELNPIKYIGEYTVKVHIFAEIVAEVKLSVIRNTED